jgi:hypothetical protein
MQCGGSTKKMKTGGTAKKGLCPDGYYWTVQGCEKKMPGHKGPFSSTGSKIGVGIPLAGMIGAGVSAISKAIKNKKAKKKEEAAAKPTEETKKRGGAKYQRGGIAKQEIVGMPGYNARTDTMKMGGAKKSKLAAMAAPKGKITRADVITAAKRNARKK